jgi:hypothetical protein
VFSTTTRLLDSLIICADELIAHLEAENKEDDRRGILPDFDEGGRWRDCVIEEVWKSIRIIEDA